jgi:glycosyltransferase involved in cell wall biosynthesis
VERQILGLIQASGIDEISMVVSFQEGGRCREFLETVERAGFQAVALKKDTPHFFSAVQELSALLRQSGAEILCCHGYKADILGRLAARNAGIPIIAVSHGWTSEDRKVRFYEAFDRINLRWMDRVVCVSKGQADKVRRAGVPDERLIVIYDAICAERFDHVDSSYKELLRSFFANPPRRLVGAAGRLSPEKGFSVLIEAAAHIVHADPSVGFVLFGEGRLHSELSRHIAAAGLQDRFILPGFRTDLDQFLPFFDLVVLPSFTEGLPNIVLEAFAARVPVVATAVGGTPEVVEDGDNGYLIAPGDPQELARRILQALGSEATRRALGLRGHQRVLEDFTFATQAIQYRRLFRSLLHPTGGDDCPSGSHSQEMGVPVNGS